MIKSVRKALTVTVAKRLVDVETELFALTLMVIVLVARVGEAGSVRRRAVRDCSDDTVVSYAFVLTMRSVIT